MTEEQLNTLVLLIKKLHKQLYSKDTSFEKQLKQALERLEDSELATIAMLTTAELTVGSNFKIQYNEETLND